MLNLRSSFIDETPDRDQQIALLRTEMTRSINAHFGQMSPVCFELSSVTITPNSKHRHPEGWNAFDVRINVIELARNVRGFPSLRVDLAAPEALLHNSVSPLDVGGHQILAYTLERIAGEKLRAFLSSLPAYRAKSTRPGDAVRAKDLYDISLILRARPITGEVFWHTVGQEFHLACKSRYVDCAGLATFREQWEVTRKTYAAASIPSDIPFDEVETSLAAIVAFLERDGIIPFAFELPKH